MVRGCGFCRAGGRLPGRPGCAGRVPVFYEVGDLSTGSVVRRGPLRRKCRAQRPFPAGSVARRDLFLPEVSCAASPFYQTRAERAFCGKQKTDLFTHGVKEVELSTEGAVKAELLAGSAVEVELLRGCGVKASQWDTGASSFPGPERRSKSGTRTRSQQHPRASPCAVSSPARKP
ncbi:hypothetical protein HJG60_008349 [Phyllostomus discolor]|uniref:Uncharacterized protein n=1 Tax=Phyllostomus discolor TaxID=89673 RepID=A0A834DQ99_9CHIR|nr:hypothetical protein HJG60_008349 [Phyllostomus discolor]